MKSLEAQSIPIDYEYDVLKEALGQQYEQIQRSNPSLFPPQRRRASDNLTILQALLYIAKTKSKWKDLPKEDFGNWNSIHKRFSDWEKKWATEGTTDLIKKAFHVIDWAVLMKKHTLTRLRFLKECASSKAPHQDSASDADNTFTPDGLPNDPPSNTNTDGIKENDLHVPGTAKGNEADSESTISSAVNPPDADTMTGKVAQPKNQNLSSGMATLPTTIRAYLFLLWTSKWGFCIVSH